MGVSVEGGKGRGRKVNAEFNLVPFIDLLSVLITFLIATAVWVELSSMQVDQSISDPNTPPAPPEDPPPPPPLTIHLRADGIWLGRKSEEGKNYPLLGTTYDWAGIEKDIETDRREYPEEEQAVIVTDDGIEYQHMIKTLDLTRKHGFEKTLLGGGPASSEPAR